MSRMYLCNNDEWYKRIETNNAYLGLVSGFVFEEGRVRLKTYKKIKINNKNFFEENGNFVASIGTMFYKDLFGEEALKEILHDFEKKSVTQIRALTNGSYATIIKKDNTINVFVDETETYKVYYSKCDNGYIISNSFYQIADCVKHELNENELIENFMRGSLGKNTRIKNIFLLKSNEKIEINTEKDSFIVSKCELNNYSKNYQTKEDFLHDLLEETMSVSKLKAKYIKRPILFLTGGVDSRLQLSLDLTSGMKPTLAYWMGKDIITNGTSKDEEIGKKIAQKSGLDYLVYSVDEDFSESLKSALNHKNMYGEYSSIYGGNSKWYNIFESMKDYDMVEFGCSGEIIREVSSIDKSFKEPFSIYNLIETVIDRGGIGKAFFELEEYENSIINDLSNYTKDMNLDDLKKSEAFRLFTFTRFGPDVINNNFVNLFAYSFPLLSSKKIVDMVFSVPYEWLLEGSIPIGMIEKLDKTMLETEFYSHHRKFRYSKKNHRLKKSMYFTAIDYLKPRIVNTKTYSFLYIGFFHKYIRPHSINNDKILEKCIEILKNSKSLIDSGIQIKKPNNWKEIDVAGLAVRTADLMLFDSFYVRDEDEKMEETNIE